MNKLVRLIPLAGLVYLVLELAGNGSIGSFPDENTPSGKLETFYQAHHAGVERGRVFAARRNRREDGARTRRPPGSARSRSRWQPDHRQRRPDDPAARDRGRRDRNARAAALALLERAPARPAAAHPARLLRRRDLLALGSSRRHLHDASSRRGKRGGGRLACIRSLSYGGSGGVAVPTPPVMHTRILGSGGEPRQTRATAVRAGTWCRSPRSRAMLAATTQASQSSCENWPALSSESGVNTSV